MSDDGKNPGENTRTMDMGVTVYGNLGGPMQYSYIAQVARPQHSLQSWESGFSLYQGAQTGTSSGGRSGGGGSGLPIAMSGTMGYGRSGSVSDQSGIVYDLISEGPIEGLVNGASSIYLNGTAMRDAQTTDAQKAFRTTGSISGSSAVLTVPDGVLDDIDTDTDQFRYVTIYGAGTQPSGITFSMSAGSPRIEASGSFFTAAMVGQQTSTSQFSGWKEQYPLILEGAGPDGTDLYTRFVRWDSATVAWLETNASTTVSGETLKMGAIKRISSIDKSANTITLVSTVSTTVSDAHVIVSAPTWDMGATEKGNWNFSNVGYAFKNGTIDQDPLNQQSSVMTNATYMMSPNTPLLRNSSYGGKASDTVISNTNMGLANPEEIDRIKLQFEAPSGLYLRDSTTGDFHNSYVELKIFFEYSNDNGSSFQKTLIYGRTDAEIAAAGRQQLWVVEDGVTVTYNQFEGTNFKGGNLAYVGGPVKSKRMFEKQFNIERFQPFTDWRVRIKRVSSEKPHDDNADVGLEDKFNGPHQVTLKNVEAMVTDSLNYPLSAYASVQFGAEDFPQPPNRAYHVRGMKIKVPTNYITREEAVSNQAKYTRNVVSGAVQTTEQDWDGNFRGDVSTFATSSNNYKTVYCNNPAWVFYDICTNTRYGLGSIMEESMIDKYALYSIARYCDELVSDGKGGQEPRFTCNVYMGKAVETYKVLKDLATVFRGILYWVGGQLRPVQDSPREPTYTFTPGNIAGGQFEYETVSDRVKKNQIRVTYNDPELNYAPNVEIVEDYDNVVETNRFIPQDVIAFGCTSKGQARRVGLWHLLTSRQETEIVKFATGEQGAFLQPGDIVNIQDHLRYSVEYSGRVSAGSPTPTTTTFGLDRAVTLASGATYEAMVFFPGSAAVLNQDSATINSTAYSRGDIIVSAYTAGSPSVLETITTEQMSLSMVDDDGDHITLGWAENGHIQVKTVSTSAGVTSHLTVSSAFTEAPEVETVWALRNTSGGIYEPKQYKVITTEEEEDGVINVLASFHFARKYDAIDNGYAASILNSPSKLARRESRIPKPTDLSLNFATSSTDKGLEPKGTTLETTLVAELKWSEPLEVTPTETIYTQIGSPHVPAISKIISDTNDTQKTIYINDATYFDPSGGFARIGQGDNSEWIKFTGTSYGSPQALTGVTRGVNFTLPKYFTADKAASVVQHVTVERRYQELAGYEIEIHSGYRDAPYKATSPTNSFSATGVKPGNYQIKVRTVSTRGNKSDFTVMERSLQHSVSVAGDKTYQLPRGGYISSTMKIDTTSGELTFHHPNFVLQSVTGNTYEYENVSEVSETVEFGGLLGGNIGFLAHHPQNASPGNFTTDFKALQVQRHDGFKFSDAEVSPTITESKQWLKVVGESGSPDNFGLAQASGTIATTAGSMKVTGSSTSFSTDFSPGDMIRFDTSSSIALNETAWYGEVANVVSDTEIALNETIDRTFSGDYVFKQTFKPDFLEDSLITRVVKDDADKFTLLPFSGTTIGPNAIQSTEVAANSIGSASIQTGIIDASILADNSIAASLIAPNAVTAVHISANSIENAAISAGAIESAQIAANSIGTAQITSGSIESLDIAANAIENVNIAANAIDTANITSGSIENVNIAANAIDTANISAGSINSVMMGANAIESVNISSGAIDTVNIAANAITEATISANSITNASMAANAITFGEIQAGSIQSASIAANAIAAASIAAGAIEAVKIAANAIAQTNIQADAIGSVELSTNAVINANIASDSIESANLSAGSVVNAAIAANSIEQTNISAQAVNAVIIAPNALENFHISVNAITGSNIAEDTIEQAMIAANAIGTAQIAANSIGAAAIVAGSIGVASMAVNSIGTTQIVAGSIDTTEIAADAITNAKIDAGAITSASLAANSITAVAIEASTITAAKIGSNAITNAAIAGLSIYTAQIAANQITTAKIKSDEIESAHIQANAITTAKIAAGSIDTAEIAAEAITNAKIEANAITAASIAANAIGSVQITAGSIESVDIAANAVRTTLSNEISSVTIDGSGLIYSGTKSSYSSTNAGWILDASTGTGRLNIGTSTNYVKFDGTDMTVRGTLNIGGTDLTATNTFNTNTTASDVGLGNVDNNSTSTIRAVAAGTSGTMGGWSISSTAITSGNITLDNANNRILITD